MTVPTVNAVINFSTGPSFAQAMILDSGILDTNVLADSASVIVDVSNQVDSIQTIRGRNAQADQFQTGTLSLRIVDQNGDFNPQNPSGPYYNLLTPMRKVQITAIATGTNYFCGGAGRETNVTGNMLQNMIVSTTQVSILTYNNGYPAGNGYRLTGTLFYEAE
jgi:hypothetical protein